MSPVLGYSIILAIHHHYRYLLYEAGLICMLWLLLCHATALCILPDGCHTRFSARPDGCRAIDTALAALWVCIQLCWHIWTFLLQNFRLYLPREEGYQNHSKEGRPLNEVTTSVKKQYPYVQLSAWMFWPIVGWTNHQYIPSQFRVIFHSVVACCWGIFLNLRAEGVMSQNNP